LTATLFSRVRWSKPGEPGEELLMVMVKEDPRSTQEAVYILQTSAPSGRRAYRVVHAKARQSVTFREDPVEADVMEAPVDADVAHGLERSWGAMALGARWPERTTNIARMKWPGIFYTFDYRGDNVFGQGDTVSPNPGTCSAGLVNLGELLKRYASEQDATKRQTIRDQLLRESQALAARLGTIGTP
jgi:hypothetical protein